MWHGSNTLLVRRLQMAGLQTCPVVEDDGFEVVLAVVVIVGGVVVVTHGVPGTCHWPADSEQLST